MYGALLMAALQAVSVTVQTEPEPDTLRPVADSVDYATAFANDATRELVRLARSHRGLFDNSVFHYTTTAHQRISVGIRALRRERVVFRRETVSEIEWWRDRQSVIRVKGAREAVPVAMPGIQVPDDLEEYVEAWMPEPGDDRLFVSAGTEGGFAWHPLVEGGEALYRYAIGDTTVIQLPDGRRIRLAELRVTPRERDIRVVTGSFWVELDDYAIVQALFRPARDFDLERDLAEIDPGEEDEVDEVPALLKPIRFVVDFVAVDYGLWEGRWWMPRLMAFHGSVSMGAITLPLSVELTYDDYTVEPDPLGLPELPPVYRHLAGDTTVRRRPYRYGTRVEVPDSAELVNSPNLAPSFFGSGETLISERELRDLGDRLGVLPPAPWEASRPRITPPWVLGRGLVRYNRVEGFSTGVRADWDLGRMQIDGTARIGHADRRPGFELGADIPTLRRRWRVGGYHRLAVADPSFRPLGLGNSLTAFLFGRDDGTYFRATGAEVRVSPGAGSAYDLRVYGELQRSADRNTHLSVPHLLNGRNEFRANIAADAADQVGVALRVGGERGKNPTGFRWGAWLDLTAETGTATFARPGLTLRASGPVAGLLAAVEAAGGTTFQADGTVVPVQSAWFLGGPGTLRGFHGGALTGPDFARARAELANRFPGVRVALFADAGWAGTFDTYAEPDVALSAGVGASFLDGLVRLDLARALQPEPATRLELYIDAIL